MGVLIAQRKLTNLALLLGRVFCTHCRASPSGHSNPSARPRTDPIWIWTSHLQPVVRSGVHSPRGAGEGREARVPSCGPLTPASLGTAPLVVWGRLVCLCLKFPDSEFDVRAGLLVGGRLGGEIVSAQMHTSGSFPREHGCRTETDGQRMVGCEMPGLGIEVTFSSPRPTFPGAVARSTPFPLMAAPLVPLRALRGSAVLGVEGWAHSVPVYGAVSCVMTSRGLLTFSEIIL